MDCAVRDQPSAPGEPRLPYAGHPDDSRISGALRRYIFLSPPVGLRPRTLRSRMDLPVHRTRLRRQGTRVLSRLEIPVRRRPMVVGQGARQSVILQYVCIVFRMNSITLWVTQRAASLPRAKSKRWEFRLSPMSRISSDETTLPCTT